VQSVEEAADEGSWEIV
jgi:LysM repeat protein